ncbi:MAG TPA: YbhB/YbcL family Raf kinase inhibitor-like protein [Armatimonadota bacterium]|nr:YbhB/YbcL family Raf kinase inhibitor-like protein [Armatimonadota bacterium]
MDIRLKSSAFSEGDRIPERYTCDGANISPPLQWTNVPITTKGLAIICDDPDAPSGTWTHWIIWNIPTDITDLPEHVSPRPMLDNGAIQGMNDSFTIGYSGPCPPKGPEHNYHFTIYALETLLSLSGQVQKEQLLQAMQGHILSQGVLMGRYGRS